MDRPIDVNAGQHETQEVPSSNRNLPLSHLASILKVQRDEARRRVAEQDQALVALHQACQRDKAELSVLRKLKEEIDDDSETRVEELAALQLALSQAQQLAMQSEARAARYEAELARARRELQNCRGSVSEQGPTSSERLP